MRRGILPASLDHNCRWALREGRKGPQGRAFSWPGASGTNWWVDPREELTVVFMAHTPGPIRWKYRQMINALVYQSLAGLNSSAGVWLAQKGRLWVQAVCGFSHSLGHFPPPSFVAGPIEPMDLAIMRGPVPINKPRP
jgi:hypothetical protein